jgi:hypothetical protein
MYTAKATAGSTTRELLPVVTRANGFARKLRQDARVYRDVRRISVMARPYVTPDLVMQTEVIYLIEGTGPRSDDAWPREAGKMVRPDPSPDREHVVMHGNRGGYVEAPQSHPPFRLDETTVSRHVFMRAKVRRSRLVTLADNADELRLSPHSVRWSRSVIDCRRNQVFGGLAERVYRCFDCMPPISPKGAPALACRFPMLLIPQATR